MADHTTTSTTESALPFSPIPGDFIRPGSGFTDAGTPLFLLAQDRYREAAFLLLAGRLDSAAREARTARDMELAYLDRYAAETTPASVTR